MPRSAQDIIDQAEQLAAHFEEGFSSDIPAEIASLRAAAHRRAVAEGDIARAVVEAVRAGRSWREVGEAVGTSGEAARQRYGKLAGQPSQSVANAVKAAVEDAAKLTRDATRAIVSAAADSATGRAAMRGAPDRSSDTRRSTPKPSSTTVRKRTNRTATKLAQPAAQKGRVAKSSEPAAANTQSQKRKK
jgi:hypothetical protein